MRYDVYFLTLAVFAINKSLIYFFSYIGSFFFFTLYQLSLFLTRNCVTCYITFVSKFKLTIWIYAFLLLQYYFLWSYDYLMSTHVGRSMPFLSMWNSRWLYLYFLLLMQYTNHQVTQGLYEGIKLSDGEATGLITYMRTDGVHVGTISVRLLLFCIKLKYNA